MSEATVQVMVAIFMDESAAKTALDAVRQLKHGLQGAILVVKDESAKKIHYKDVGLTPGKGATGGALLGATVGILTGGAGLVLGAAGAALGGLIGKKKQDSRFNANQLNQVATSIKPGEAAVVAVVESDGADAVIAVLEQYQADWLITDVSADLARQLQERREAAHSLLAKKLQHDE